MYHNHVFIIGNITRKPELKVLPSGTKVINLNIAVNSTWTDKTTHEKKESVEFISVMVFGQQAENCATWLDKGQKVLVEGKIKNRVEETEKGKRYHTGIIASRVQFGPKPNGTSKNTANDRTEVSEEVQEPSQGGFEYPESDINPEDMPF